MSKLATLKHFIGTLLGRPRREHFLRILPMGSVGAEIGVFRGEFTDSILRIVQPKRLHLLDAWWTLYGERYPDWGAYTDHGSLETRVAFEDAQRVVQKHRSANLVCEFHIGDDVESIATFQDGYFDWVYLDTSHSYEHTKNELDVLRHKVKVGGVIAGDDWREDPSHGHHGVCKAVREFCLFYGWELVKLDVFGQWCIRRAGVIEKDAKRARRAG